MVRAPCIDKNGMKKGAWSEDEDNKLRDYIERYGHWNWRELPKYAGNPVSDRIGYRCCRVTYSFHFYLLDSFYLCLKFIYIVCVNNNNNNKGLARCGKSCRLRWMNYLRPSVKRGDFTKEEEDIIIKLHLDMGNKWSAIAALLPGRSDNEIKNHWHTHLKKRSTKQNNKVVHEVKEDHKSRIERIINFSVLPPSVVSTSSENRISNESTVSYILSHESTTSQRNFDDSTSRSCVQRRLLIDLNQEYAESWEEDSELKEELEC